MVDSTNKDLAWLWVIQHLRLYLSLSIWNFFESKLLSPVCYVTIKWFRYFDNILCLWPGNSGPSECVEDLNRLVSSMKFKTEKEVDGSLFFLDTLNQAVDYNVRFTAILPMLTAVQIIFEMTVFRRNVCNHKYVFKNSQSM